LGLLLLAYGADAQARYGESGHTPLSWAITCNALEFARTFVRLGIKPDLFCAAGVGSLEHVQAWFDESGQLKPGASDTGSSRYSPDGTRLPCPPSNASEQISDALYIACRNHHTDVVRFLLTKRPDLSFRAYLGGTPLHWAYYSGGGTEIIDLLHRAGADTTARDDVYRCLSREWSMIAPAGMGIPGIVRARLAVDPALANTPGARTSPLHEATRIGHAEIVRLLLDAGADPTYRNDEGQTPLELARSHPATGYPAVIELLQAAARRDS
jgi:ankyrin repeat protein